EGKPKVTAIIAAEGFDETGILQLAASVERASEHPLADAIVRAANQRNLSLSSIEQFDSPAGKGATGKVDQKAILVGSSDFLNSAGIETNALREQAEALRRDGATVINIGVDGKLGGLFAIADPVKPSTPDAL